MASSKGWATTCTPVGTESVDIPLGACSAASGADYLRLIDALDDLVATLGIRDADAARRTRALLEASHGRTGAAMDPAAP